MSFEQACENVGLPATKRQKSRFQKGRGLAYRVSVHASTVFGTVEKVTNPLTKQERTEYTFEGSSNDRRQRAEVISNQLGYIG